MLYIGVDLGTSAVKLLMMDENGNIQKIVSKEYPLYFPYPGWSEQNPQDWFAQSMEGIKELTSECDKSQVAGISFGGQMHGLVVLDKEDQVIRPAILWNDGRTTKETDYLNQVIGKDKLSEYTANIAFAGFTAPKILWMKGNEPENYKKIAKIMLPKDYLAYRLSGSFCTDMSDASGMLLMDVENRCWSKEMLDICGLEQEQLPKLYESYEVVGTLKPEVAKELGVSENVKVIAGPAGSKLTAVVPSDTVVREIRTEGDLCTVNLSSEFNQAVAGSSVTPEVTVYAIVNSICESCEDITKVQIQVEGSSDVLLRDTLDLSQVFSCNSSFIREKDGENDTGSSDNGAVPSVGVDPNLTKEAQTESGT